MDHETLEHFRDRGRMLFIPESQDDLDKRLVYELMGGDRIWEYPVPSVTVPIGVYLDPNSDPKTIYVLIAIEPEKKKWLLELPNPFVHWMVWDLQKNAWEFDGQNVSKAGAFDINTGSHTGHREDLPSVSKEMQTSSTVLILQFKAKPLSCAPKIKRRI